MNKKFCFEKFLVKIDTQNLSITEFAEIAKIPRQTVYSWRNANTIRNVIYRKRIEKVLNCRFDELCVDSIDGTSDNTATYRIVAGNYIELAIIGNTNSTVWLDLDRVKYQADMTKIIINKKEDADIMFAVRISNDSMLPQFDKDTIIVCDKRAEYVDGCYALVAWNQDDTTLSEFRKVFRNGNKYILRPLNASYPEVVIDNKNVVDIVKAVQTIREL